MHIYALVFNEPLIVPPFHAATFIAAASMAASRVGFPLILFAS
jgi:hypothetical protein